MSIRVSAMLIGRQARVEIASETTHIPEADVRVGHFGRGLGPREVPLWVRPGSMFPAQGNVRFAEERTFIARWIRVGFAITYACASE